MASQWRVDAVNAVPKVVAYDRGYKRTLDDLFERTGIFIGKGGFGLVTMVVERSTKVQYACKSINKRLNVPKIAPEKVEQHLANIDREVRVLKLLRGTLSVVTLKGVFEDDESVHIVMEYCKGGELYANLSKHGALTEAKVSMYMRSVLQTLAQCHSHRILHRDVKPGNFLLLSQEENSPLKAVDFGLAVMWEKGEMLPRTDLGLDGTPWFMAPEVISASETYPASDVWSAGVMCYQLLSGRLPFDDRKNRLDPALSVVWRSILTDEVSFTGKEWDTVSNEAKAFVRRLLNKDPRQRPTAREALKDPWLLSTFQAGREGLGLLDSAVVQRLQRFADANLLQRTILEMIASELVKMMPAGWLLDETVRMPPGDRKTPAMGSSKRNESDVPSERHEQLPVQNASPMSIDLQRKDSKDSRNELVFPMSPERIGCDFSRTSLQSPLKQPTNAWRITSPSPKGPKGESLDWKAMRQASELILQGSGHRQSSYLRACSGLGEEDRMEQRKAARLSLDTSVHGKSLYRNDNISHQGRCRKGQSASPRSSDFPFPADDMSPTLTVPSFSSTTPKNGRNLEEDLEKGVRGRSLALEAIESNRSTVGVTASNANSATSAVSDPIKVAPLMNKVGFRRGKIMTKSSLMQGLSTLGYNVEEDELGALMDRVGHTQDSGGIKDAEFLASQIDWKDLQRNNKELWIECAKNAFHELDASKTGQVSIEKLLQNLRSKIPDEEVDFAVEDALVDANLKDAEQVDFEGFMKLVTIGSFASLDNYPDRVSSPPKPSSDVTREENDIDVGMEE
mmetsp:Transcript_15310/g.43633  ORF Transcript_15310/g.43633 Transcript_15310/m.43633 type:complete len:794 (+) Transcript_15310:187-2568(+)